MQSVIERNKFKWCTPVWLENTPIGLPILSRPSFFSFSHCLRRSTIQKCPREEKRNRKTDSWRKYRACSILTRWVIHVTQFSNCFQVGTDNCVPAQIHRLIALVVPRINDCQFREKLGNLGNESIRSVSDYPFFKWKMLVEILKVSLWGRYNTLSNETQNVKVI